MKVCEICENEIQTRDGDNRCPSCDHTDTGAPARGDTRDKKKKRREAARARREVMESLGLVRVRGALGGVYYE